MRERKSYLKPAKTVSELLDILERRGMRFEDKQNAQIILQNIGYYRFSGYSYVYRKEPEWFKENTVFERIYDAYLFDQKLRLMTFAELERIEISFRASFSQHMSDSYGAHWFFEKTLFKETRYFSHSGLLIAFEKTLNENRSQPFIKHYFENYDTPEMPPSWVIMEILSFGSVSKMFKNLAKNSDKEVVSRCYDIPSSRIFGSWVESLAVLRNLCAHHSRLWNRSFTKSPELTARMKDLGCSRFSFSSLAFLINYFGLRIKNEKAKSYVENLALLLEEFPDVKPCSVGLGLAWPDKWQEKAGWEVL